MKRLEIMVGVVFLEREQGRLLLFPLLPSLLRKHLLVSCIIGLLSMALAHQPYWNEGSPTPEEAFIIANVSVSKALFGNLQAGEVDYYKLTVPNGFTVDSSLFVGEGCKESFNPQLYLLAPGQADALAFEAPDGYSALLGEGDWQPFSTHGLVGREGPAIRKTLASSTYYFVVQANDEGGFYLLSLGGSEAFGGGAGGREAIPRFNACE
jgi:hypothetical protein